METESGVARRQGTDADQVAELSPKDEGRDGGDIGEDQRAQLLLANIIILDRSNAPMSQLHTASGLFDGHKTRI